MTEDKTASEYKCVTLKGDLKDWGKHILLPFGFTLCGMPTVDAKVKDFPSLKHPMAADMINEYTEEKEWDITCEKCHEIFELTKKANDLRKQNQN